MLTMPPAPTLRRAVARRDRRYDGAFVYAVISTGIFCRPSCPAPRPRPEHLRWFADPAAAQAAGFRPCKRCQPQHGGGRLPEWMQRLIAQLDATPDRSLRAAELRALGLHPARVRRAFRTHLGLTFAEFARQKRMQRALNDLRHGQRVTDAALTHGFTSERGFRAAFAKAFGASPRAALRLQPITVDWMPSPVGALLLGVDATGVRLLEFAGEGAELAHQIERWQRRLGAPLQPGTHPLLELLRAQLEAYFAGHRRCFELPLAAHGSTFQRSVWQALCAIPYGQTRSYAEIAAAVGRPQAMRAVGQANGANPIAVVIPCHRVVNASGALGGYGGGLWRKRRLLALECALTSAQAQAAVDR
ncbi:MAG: bifunctional transcriptional activator/DNA repair protein Ada [Gammaproteobacteria bacterium]|nr:bifunctional transcriptional activator/DNA repair protein Ada [Gammaproteobacteria bacterium]